MTEMVVSHTMASFLMSMWINDVLKSAWKAVHVPNDGGVSARAFLVKVDAQIAADPSVLFIGVIDGSVDHEVDFYGVHPGTGFAG